jgi:hypothetical protein
MAGMLRYEIAKRGARMSGAGSRHSGGIQPEIAIAAMPDDERVWVPQAENVWFRPLFLNTVSGQWCNPAARAACRRPVAPSPSQRRLRLRDQGLVALPRARLGGDRGKLRLRARPGRSTRWSSPADCAEMITFFNISGAMIYVDESGRQTATRTCTRRSRCAARITPVAVSAGSTSINSSA